MDMETPRGPIIEPFKDNSYKKIPADNKCHTQEKKKKKDNGIIKLRI
jgi:hypothetical protein